MDEPTVELTFYDDGSHDIVSTGADGSRTVVHVDGPVPTYTTWDAMGRMTRQVRRPDNDGGFDTVTIVEGSGLTDGYLADAPSTVLPHDGHDSPPIVYTEPGGIKVTGTHTGDDTGHMIDVRHFTEGIDKDGNIIPARDVTKWTHPKNDPWHPKDSSSVTETGTIHEPGAYHGNDGITHGAKSDSYYGKTTWYVPRPDSDGGGKFTVSSGSEYQPTSGDRQTVVSVTQPDGSSMRSWRVTHQDGTWEEHRRAVDKDGNGEEQVTTGDKSGQKTSETRTVKGEKDEKKEKEKKDEEEYDDHGGDDGAPVGDGENGGNEGNPDGPFAGWDAISLANLFGDDGEEHEGLETLGDMDGLMSKYRERVEAALRASGMRADGEVLDTLGAPPFVGYVPYPVEDDELKDYDSTGRPRPIHHSTVEIGELAAGAKLEVGTALDVSTMLQVAQHVRGVSERPDGSFDLVLNVGSDLQVGADTLNP